MLVNVRHEFLVEITPQEQVFEITTAHNPKECGPMQRFPEVGLADTRVPTARCRRSQNAPELNFLQLKARSLCCSSCASETTQRL